MRRAMNGEQERYARAVATLNDARLAALYARILQALAAAPQPAGQILSASEQIQRLGRVGLLAGSFNPLTRAHVALAEAARFTGRLDAILWTLSVSTVDKEHVERASLVDRLLQMRAFVDGRPDALALINRGLYVELAGVARSLLPNLEELVIVVGFDKIVQILDPRYYEDRDAVLDQLFTSASLLVAPRSDENEERLNELTSREENRRYQGRITFCPFPKRFRGDSSSNARAIAREPGSGRRLRAILPPEGQALVVATGVYSGRDDKDLRHADAYSRRQALISWIATLDPNSDEVTRSLDDRMSAMERPGEVS